MESTSLLISVLFIGTVIFTVLFLYHAIKRSRDIKMSLRANQFIIVIICWLVIQAIFGYYGIYYDNLKSIPPKIMLYGIFPALLIIITFFTFRLGRTFINGLPLRYLTLIHIIRVPIEVVLFLLSLKGVIPSVMTFDGLNFDILSGITAPVMAYFGVRGKRYRRKILLVWNIVCLALLLTVVIIAIISIPGPFQKIAFDHPNTAILYFPYCWLPTFIVPVVLFSHLVSIRKCLKNKNRFI